MKIGSGQTFSNSFDELHDAASERTGVSDFGDTEYHLGLRYLLYSLDKDVPFTEQGVAAAKSLLTGVLIQRLLTEEGWKNNPRYRQVNIERPIVIVGLPRTGTTALHSLLARDDRFQGIEAWLTTAPMVRPARDKWENNPFYQAFVEATEKKKAHIPELAAIHDTVAGDLEENVLLCAQNFVSNYFCVFGAVSYDDWWWGQSELSSYSRFADTLRLIGLTDSRHWLLKCPHHLFDMNSLFEVFPDACVVHTHRDPAKAIPSVCSYLKVSRRALFVGENCNPGLLGPVEAVKWLHALARSEPSRVGREDQFCDVLHGDFLEDPIGEVRRIYRQFGLVLTPEIESRMHSWLDSQPAEQKGGHQYTASQFGLNEAALREMYANYMENYGLC